jgi:hypothetical protein
MRVLVCGGRAYYNRDLIYRTLDGIHDQVSISCIIHGNAKGADILAGNWAKYRSVRCDEFEADWIGQGRSAGPKRNALMLKESKPDLVVAFPGGRGTADMMRKAKAAGITVKEIKAEISIDDRNGT